MKCKFFTVILAMAAISDAAVNLGVSLGDSIRPVTHVATGSLYGITEKLPSDIDKDLAPLKPNVFWPLHVAVMVVSRGLVARFS